MLLYPICHQIPNSKNINKIILLYWLGSTWFISQTKLGFNMKLKLELTINFLILRSNTSTLSSSNKHVIKLIWFERGVNSQLNKNLVRYEFIFQASIKLITRVINKPRFNSLFFFFYQALLFICLFINNFLFYLGLTYF